MIRTGRPLSKFATLFGHYSIDKNMTNQEWAKEFGISPGLISHVINGKRKIPKYFRTILIKKMELNQEQIMELDEAIDEQNNSIKTRESYGTDTRRCFFMVFCEDIERINTMKTLCKYINKFDNEDIKTIENIINKHKGETHESDVSKS